MDDPHYQMLCLSGQQPTCGCTFSSLPASSASSSSSSGTSSCSCKHWRYDCFVECSMCKCNPETTKRAKPCRECVTVATRNEAHLEPLLVLLQRDGELVGGQLRPKGVVQEERRQQLQRRLAHIGALVLQPACERPCQQSSVVDVAARQVADQHVCFNTDERQHGIQNTLAVRSTS